VLDRHSSVTEVTALLNEALREVWAGKRMVGGKHVVCDEDKRDGEEDNQDNIASLLPTSGYSSDHLQRWMRIWQILEVEEVDIHELILLAVRCYLPDWRGDEVQNWAPGAPRPLRRVWDGTGVGQGQIRLRGGLISAQDRNTHQLREVYAVNGRQAFEERQAGTHHHLPLGTERSPRREHIQLGIPCSNLLTRVTP
jgi:hypothetical protein